MTDVDQSAELELADEPQKSPLKFWGMIAGAVLLLVVAGGAAWYFLLGGRAHFGGAHQVEAPLPYFIELKPFVVTVASRAGPTHFVQLGVSFQIPGPEAAAMITAILPKVQDVLRQTVLGFKAEDMQSPAGLDKVRAAMLTDVNRTLGHVLGPARIDKADAGKPGGKPGAELVQQIEFSTLVVE